MVRLTPSLELVTGTSGGIGCIRRVAGNTKLTYYGLTPGQELRGGRITQVEKSVSGSEITFHEYGPIDGENLRGQLIPLGYDKDGALVRGSLIVLDREPALHIASEQQLLIPLDDVDEAPFRWGVGHIKHLEGLHVLVSAWSGRKSVVSPSLVNAWLGRVVPLGIGLLGNLPEVQSKNTQPSLDASPCWLKAAVNLGLSISLLWALCALLVKARKKMWKT